MPKYFRSSDLTHEIASAVFRVSALVRHGRLRKELEESAVALVKDIHLENVDTLERLVRLTAAVEEVSEINAMVLCRELGNLRVMLNAEISESLSGVSNSLNLQEVFTEKSIPEEGEERQEVGNQGERQKAVLEYIRKFPNGCRLRQLSVAFPGFSERTIRTDIQRLIGRGLVEKIGSKTGPFSYFRTVDSTHSTGSGQASSQPSQNATAGTAPPVDLTIRQTHGGEQDRTRITGLGQAESPVTKEEPSSL